VSWQAEIISVYYNGYVALELNTFDYLTPALQDFLAFVHAVWLLCSSFSYPVYPSFLIVVNFLADFNDGKDYTLNLDLVLKSGYLQCGFVLFCFDVIFFFLINSVSQVA